MRDRDKLIWYDASLPLPELGRAGCVCSVCHERIMFIPLRTRREGRIAEFMTFPVVEIMNEEKSKALIFHLTCARAESLGKQLAGEPEELGEIFRKLEKKP